MADFSALSDTDESAVEEILSEAADHATLQQISAINLSVVSDSDLPHHLDTSCRGLKNFHSSQSPTASLPSRAEWDENPAVKLTESEPRLSPSASAFSGSSNSWLEEAKLSPRWKVDEGSGSVSPPMSGCLCCSPRRISRKKSFKGGGGRRLNDDILGELGQGSLSRGKQERLMKKAVEEETKIAREAEKVVEWALNASARMHHHDVIDDK